MFKKLLGNTLKNVRLFQTTPLLTSIYVWIDLEMTGLNVEKDSILEVACVVTDENLEVKHSGINLIVHQPDDVLKSMNEWCLKQHGESGLTEASKQSMKSISDVDMEVAEYIKCYGGTETKYIAGNSVYMDKIFIDKYMPEVSKQLHYRIIDVSTLKVLCEDWYKTKISEMPKKTRSHRALSDILESINELRCIKKLFFIEDK